MDKKTYKDKFAANFNRLIKNARLKKKDVAHQLGVSNTTITNWSQGKQVPEGKNLRDLAELFSISEKALTGTYTKEELAALDDENFMLVIDNLQKKNQIAESYYQREQRFDDEHPKIRTYRYVSDDMEPTLPADAILEVDEHCAVKDGDIAFFNLGQKLKNGDSIPRVARRVLFTTAGDWILINDNPRQLDKLIVSDMNQNRSFKPVNRRLDVSLIGVVVGYRYRFYGEDVGNKD